MAVAATKNAEQAVSLATTVTRITGTGQCKTLLLYESDVDVYVVTSDVADGAALPSAGRVKFTAAKLPVEFNIAPYGYIGLAGASAGTVRCEFRSS